MAADPRQRLGEFAGYLREHGFALGYAEVELMTRAAAGLPLRQWQRVESLWRAIVSGSRKQWLKYPDLHQAFWFPHKIRGSTRSSGVTRRGRTLPELVQQLRGEPGDAPPATAAVTRGGGYQQGHDELDADAGDTPRAQGGASRTEALEQRDFADWSREDLDRFEPWVEAFQRRLRKKLLRRWEGAVGGYTIHLRRSMRSALGTGGELLELYYKRRRRRRPRVVLLVDVSRSMEAHAHFFLRLARTFVEVMHARAFVFHTRLADVTELMKRRSTRVQEKINAVTFGFGGGTRIASCLHAALHQHLARTLSRGDLVLIFSDGYDTDEPGALAAVLSEIRSRGARIFWLHPTVQPPQSAAMALARTEVSGFMPAYNLASLSRLPQLVA